MESERLTDVEQPAGEFKANGVDLPGAEYDPQPRAKAPIEPPTEDEQEAVFNLHVRRLTPNELDKVQTFISRMKDKHQAWVDEQTDIIRKKAYENVEVRKENAKRARELDRKETKLATKDKALAEKLEIIEQRDKFMAEMPKNMDEAATRAWLLEQRKFLLSTYRALAEHSTDDRIRMQALQRLSDEDRGQHGKDLKEDEDAGPGVIMIEKGSFGIPE